MSAKAILSASVSAPPAVYVEDVFSTFLYTGNGGTQTITNGIDLSGEGGLVWCKSRTDTFAAQLYDTARGAGFVLNSSVANPQSDLGATGVSFTSSGFTVGSSGGCNNNGSSLASWTFRKAPKFFDVVTYTGNGAVGRQLSHSLGSTPGCIFVKCTSDASTPWIVYHRSIVSTGWLELASTTAVRDFGAGSGLVPFGTITSTYATLYDAFTETNATAKTYVAYLFAHDAGGFGDAGTDNVISCGTTTVSSNTASVTLGYEPQWVMMKRTSGISDWFLVDNMRGFSSSASPFLRANDSSIESANAGTQCNATGFTSSGVFDNGTYIYIAIRRGPMKTPTVGTEVFKALTRTGTGAAGFVTGVGFAPDALINAEPARLSVSTNLFYDKLRSPLNYLDSTSTDAESSGNSAPLLFTNEGLQLTTGNRANTSSRLQLDYYFRRAPGFFDVVCFTVSGGTPVPHNLKVRPELIIYKTRGSTDSWWTLADVNGAGQLNQSSAFFSTGSGNGLTYFAQATSTTISNLNGILLSNSNTVVAYLFASAPGVSKVGSYTGTGTGYTVDVNCGFTTGARFVLIKRTDSTGDWFVWDTARGIISGNDPYLLLNTTDAEVTGTDYIDPLSTGFQISSTAPAAINASGGNFIFLAIS